MLFNSFHFLLFFPIVCALYFLMPKREWRNMFLLIASYYFYMNWEPIYALLIMGSTMITFLCGKYVGKETNERKRKIVLSTSLLINFGILFLFKYYNFINDSVFTILESANVRWDMPEFTLLLPVGISFYTFQAVGYSIDVYKGTIKPEDSFRDYALFVSFFPQLVAGPIERAKNLLPQFKKKHALEYYNVSQGFKWMLWGYFMKLCVADRLSMYVDSVYGNIPHHNGTSLLIATIFFTFQIYCDFCGYSLIAIGASKVMGFNLMENFRRPYFATSIREFWKKWHISLSTWFMDYVYIPLGGNRVSYSRHLGNLMITFLVSGIWHGANWNFLIWGAIHGVYIIIENLISKVIKMRIVFKPFNIIFCFVLVSFAWIFFRASNFTDAKEVINKIFTQQGSLFIEIRVFAYGGFSLFILILKEFLDEFIPSKFNFINNKNYYVSISTSIVLICYILLFGVFDGGQFIYFQF